MSKFAQTKINGLNVKSPVYQLVIDDCKQIDDFENQVKSHKQYYSEYKTLLRYIEQIANGGTLPRKKYHYLDPQKGNDPVKEFEFKSKHLRIYGIIQPNGRILMMGGYKNTQEKDINAFQALKKRYLNQK